MNKVSAWKHVVFGALIGLGVAALAMAVYCLVRLSPYLSAGNPDTAFYNEDMLGRILLHSIVYFGILAGPLGVAVGALIGAIVVVARRRAH